MTFPHRRFTNTTRGSKQLACTQHHHNCQTTRYFMFGLFLLCFTLNKPIGCTKLLAQATYIALLWMRHSYCCTSNTDGLTYSYSYTTKNKNTHLHWNTDWILMDSMEKQFKWLKFSLLTVTYVLRCINTCRFHSPTGSTWSHRWDQADRVVDVCDSVCSCFILPNKTFSLIFLLQSGSISALTHRLWTGR